MSGARPVALFISWTCYGTWLPGDERGHVSNTWSDDPGWQPKENSTGAPYRADDRFTRNSARNRQKFETVQLDARKARCVAECLVETARKRDWRVFRAAVMANHIHVLVLDSPDDGPAVRRILKGNTQAALNRLVGEPRRWWTAGGSNRYRKGKEAISAADQYIRDQEYILAPDHAERPACFFWSSAIWV